MKNAFLSIICLMSAFLFFVVPASAKHPTMTMESLEQQGNIPLSSSDLENLLTGRTLNIFSMIGMIMLMGLVTKNAILLIDYTNQLRRRGMPRNDAVLKAGPVRLRPITAARVPTQAIRPASYSPR